jgi:hypothetical protein
MPYVAGGEIEFALDANKAIEMRNAVSIWYFPPESFRDQIHSGPKAGVRNNFLAVYHLLADFYSDNLAVFN